MVIIEILRNIISAFEYYKIFLLILRLYLRKQKLRYFTKTAEPQVGQLSVL